MHPGRTAAFEFESAVEKPTSLPQRPRLKSASLRFRDLQPGEANCLRERCLRRLPASSTKLLPENEALRGYEFLHACLSSVAGERTGRPARRSGEKQWCIPPSSYMAAPDGVGQHLR